MSFVFVFGSNREGRHGKGAALRAVEDYGAKYGQAVGRQGSSYAIPTKELRRGFPRVELAEIAVEVKEFLRHAEENDNDDFFVTAIGCGLAGYTVADIAPLFRNSPDNVQLNQQFEEWLRVN